jgi:predicted metal-dependent hydrolase
VVHDGHRLRVHTREQDISQLRGLLQNWYRRQALRVFPARLAVVSDRAAWVAGRKLTLKVRRMKRSWGNCSSAGVIKLNTHLIKAPVTVIDSVIAHELCHLLEMNHSRNFYALLQTLNPGWKQDRQTLLSESGRYLR